MARLRAMQERAADAQAEQDELRAKRYQEEKDRKWREKEMAEAERRAAMNKWVLRTLGAGSSFVAFTIFALVAFIPSMIFKVLLARLQLFAAVYTSAYVDL